MKTILLLFGSALYSFSFAQNMQTRITAAIKDLEADVQFKHAIIGLYIVDAKTGMPVFDKNSQTGLAPASCQKVVTSASAFEMLGKDFHYTTYIGTDPQGNKKFDAGSLFIVGKGDPTLGSWRWKSTTDSSVFSGILEILRKNKISGFERSLCVDDAYYGLQLLPGGWTWEDIGNYYGAACYGFNWLENQYDLLLQPGQKAGEPASVVSTDPKLPGFNMINNITTGPAGSGDNGYIYTSPFSYFAITNGTIPPQKGSFKISGSMPNPAKVFKAGLAEYLVNKGILVPPLSYTYSENILLNKPVNIPMRYIDSIISPPLDSINYWFLKKSINLYGEAFLKSIAAKYYPNGLHGNIYDTAIKLVKNFWLQKGIEPSALNIVDGSGLSPANRITTNALVGIMQYARQQKWFPSFYNALPGINGLKMKDGYIGGVRSFTGYAKSGDGNEYTFSFIVNNFSGSAGTVREKMWKLLDILK